MGTEVVPYGFQTDVLPRRPAQPLPPGVVQGVHFIMAPDDREWIFEKIEQWFAERDDVGIVDTGLSDKQGVGYIILEWYAYEVDPLFIAILTHDELIEDYTVYETEVQ